MLGYRLLQNRQDFPRLDRIVRVDAVAFPRVLVDQVGGAKLASALRIVGNEVPSLSVVAAFGLLRQSGRQPLAPAARPARRNLKPLFPANALDELLVGDEAEGPQLGRYLSVSKRRMQKRDLHDLPLYALLAIGARLRTVAQHGSIDAQPSANRSPGA